LDWVRKKAGTEIHPENKNSEKDGEVQPGKDLSQQKKSGTASDGRLWGAAARAVRKSVEEDGVE
jgi:hypothetical protein